MPLVVRAVARSHVGLVRAGNEDSGYAGRSLFVVADGMGGHAAGEVASRTVVAAMLGLDGADLGPDVEGTLRTSVDEANNRLRLAVDARPDLEGMGTTLTALAWTGEQLGLAHVGDSRAYLLRDDRLTMLTHDQTLVQTLIDDGRLSEADARTHPQRSVILQALDGRPGVEPDVTLLDPRPGDRYLICSDGLTGYVDESDVHAALRGQPAHSAVDGLIGLALEAGAPDNVTVVVVDVVEAAHAEEPDDPLDAATHDPGGVLVGAVGETAAASSEVPVTDLPPSDPTSSAAAPGERDQPDSSVSDEGEGEAAPARRRRRWPWLVGLLVVIGLIGSAFAWRWSQDQWYVGVDNGVVAVYSGVDLTVGPVSLSQLEERTGIETVTLPEFERARVEGTIAATDQEDALAIVARLQTAADACLSAPDTVGCP
ncbi:MAG TPA: protein phosphatase 2C domain-containing protein [Candidatus Limnocylindria bacterium]|nr:protein phosphatase 2C domain-containing protein [Candidatus Limnocylindria bacterium]